MQKKNKVKSPLGYGKHILASFNKQGLMKHLKASISSLSPGKCEIRIPYSKNLSQQNGFFHAGIVSTIADNAAGYAAYSLMDEDSSILTVEFKINLLAPAKGKVLIGAGKVIKKGKLLTICRTDIYYTEGKARKLCAVSQSTLIELRENK